MNNLVAKNRYEKMEYIRSGKSGLKLPKFSLGLWHNFGSESDFSNCEEMICGAFDLGISHFDLANNYGPIPGAAEINFGKILKTHLSNYRDEIAISTKAGYKMWEGPYGEWCSRKNLLSSLDQSLKRLQLDYVDIFYSHRFDSETPLEETMGALISAVKSGKALYAGISNYPADMISKAAKIMRAEKVPLIIHQARYHLLNRSIEERIVSETVDNEMGMICFCPLAQGLLTDKYLEKIPADSRAASSSIFLNEAQILPELILGLHKLNDFAKSKNLSLAQLSLAWIAQKNFVTSVLIGASRLSQIKENCQVLGIPQFSVEDLEKINEILVLMPKIR